MIRILILAGVFCTLSFTPVSGPDVHIKDYMINQVNMVRKSGCYCGKRYMHPVAPIRWSEVLYTSAENHAREMLQYNFFAHFSKDGKDIGERLQNFGYNWQVAGENLGEGQKDFDEVLEDWKASSSHCRMLMHPRVTEMAVAKIGKYWVQHFGKPME
jgi:uncharacterized protein YkwD